MSEVRMPNQGPFGCDNDQRAKKPRFTRVPQTSECYGTQVKVLGETYRITFATEDEEPRLQDCNGFCDSSAKEIGMDTLEKCAGQPDSKKNLYVLVQKALRHEILHAFLCESGLEEDSQWAQNEEMVDWFAIQGPKIYQAWKEAGAV